MRPPNTGAIDQAEAYLIANPGVTIPLAAQVFGLTVNSIRSRIAHKYGSLAEARQSGPVPQRVRKPVRRCMCCRHSAAMQPQQRICDKCKRRNAEIHEGRV